MTGRPNFCLMSRSRATVSLPCSCRMSGCSASTMLASVASSASTVSATLTARLLDPPAELARRLEAEMPRRRRKEHEPTMSAPASSAASSVSRVDRPQILTSRDMVSRTGSGRLLGVAEMASGEAGSTTSRPACLARRRRKSRPARAPAAARTRHARGQRAARRSASCALAARASASCWRAARRQRRCPNQVAQPPATTPGIATAMIRTNSGSETAIAGSVELNGSNDTVTKCRLATANTMKIRPSGMSDQSRSGIFAWHRSF